MKSFAGILKNRKDVYDSVQLVRDLRGKDKLSDLVLSQKEAEELQRIINKSRERSRKIAF